MTPAQLTSLVAPMAPLGPVPHCPELVAHQTGDLYALWESCESVGGETNTDPPFWSVVWPGAMILARYLLDRPEVARGRRVLELGCGGAVASMAAARTGALEVIANDIAPAALQVAGLNAVANGATITCCGRDRIAEQDLGDADLVLVADMFYERGPSAALLALLTAASRPGREILVADGGRAYAPKALGELLCEAELPVPEEVEGVRVRHTRLLRFGPG